MPHVSLAAYNITLRLIYEFFLALMENSLNLLVRLYIPINLQQLQITKEKHSQLAAVIA